jgi:hypothetical protein
MTGALILGATALTLSAGVASAQVAYGPGGDTGIEDYNNPNETMAQRVGLAPTLRRLVTPPLYDYAAVPTTKWVTAPQAPVPTTKWVTAPQAPVATTKWVTAPEPRSSNSSGK